MSKKQAYILVSLGEPRDEGEISSYIRSCFHEEEFSKQKKNWLFRLLRLGKIRKEIARYKRECEAIISFSPTYAQIMQWKDAWAQYLSAPIFCFFLHLPSTHRSFFEELKACQADEYYLFPTFPQFSYGLTGQITRCFAQHVKKELLFRFRWIKSYAGHPAFVFFYQKIIQEHMQKRSIREEELILLFSCAGVDKSLLEEGDLYESECEISYKEILKAFPYALGRLSFQNYYEIRSSPMQPSTLECCQTIAHWCEKRKKVLLVPLSFVVDGMSTLYEMDQIYLPLLKKQDFEAERASTPILCSEWPKSCLEIFKEKNFVSNQMLVLAKDKERNTEPNYEKASFL